MPLLQSVFCLQGYDDRSRFFALSVISLFAFILFSTIFSSNLVNVLFLLLLTLVLTLTTMRRLRDARLNKNWQLVPSGLFLITGIMIVLLNNNISYYLLLLPSLVSALLLTYPSKSNGKNKTYIFGYYGPIDLSSYQQNSENTIVQNQRIEPTLVGDSVNTYFINQDSTTAQREDSNINQNETTTSSSDRVDIGEIIRLKLLNNKRFQLGLIIGLLIIIVTVVISSLFAQYGSNDITEDATQKITPEKSLNQSVRSANKLIASKTQHLAMPDNFDLYLTAYQGVLLHWQADSVSSSNLWSQLTAKGDKSCQIINFDKGNDFRPLTIEVENNTEYFASFSPLDTQALIQAMAFRSRFSLCGYKFSLKGSQAVLGKHNSYALYLEK